MNYTHDIVGKTYKVERTSDYYALYKLDWVVGVPRIKKWVYVEVFFTQQQVIRHVNSDTFPDDAVVYWRV